MNLINETLANLSWFNLFVLTIAAYSITRLIVTDTLFEKVRDWVFKRYPHEGYASTTKPERGEARRASNNVWIVEKGTKIGNLISCPWCAGFWVSLGIFISFVFFPSVTVFVMIPFAMRAIIGGYANKIGGG